MASKNVGNKTHTPSYNFTNFTIKHEIISANTICHIGKIMPALSMTYFPTYNYYPLERSVNVPDLGMEPQVDRKSIFLNRQTFNAQIFK